MTRIFLGSFAFLLPAVVWACSGSNEQSDGDGKGASAGAAGSTTATGGNAGSATSGGTSGASAGGASGTSAGGAAGSSTGGASGSNAGGTSGAATGGASGAGTGGSGAGQGGSSGKGGDPETACMSDDDCIIATTYSTTGCCSRACGVALNADWVANEPCATADPMTDPVPLSCSTGCLLCPQDPRCEVLLGTVCLENMCQGVRTNGPCATSDDCLIGIDYETTLGACCNCPIAASKAALEQDPCIVPFGDPKPNGCEVTPANACDTAGCPGTCPQPTTSCTNTRCGV